MNIVLIAHLISKLSNFAAHIKEIKPYLYVNSNN